MSSPVIRFARFDELAAATFHDIVRLRLDTFVVEQRCPYPELDGRDLLPDTLHAWIEEAGAVTSYLRRYPGGDGLTWLGRVVTAPAARGRGLGSRLMRATLEVTEPPVRIAAQSRLAVWYAEFGFVRCGDDFIEDGILHVPMLLGAVAGLPATAAVPRMAGAVPFTVRPASPADIDGVLLAWRTSGTHPTVTDDPAGVARLIEHAPGALLVAERDGDIVGTVIAGWNGWRGSIYRIAVTPAHRRLGVGRALLEAAVARLESLGARRLDAFVVSDDAQAMAFWAALSPWWIEDPLRKTRFIHM